MKATLSVHPDARALAAAAADEFEAAMRAAVDDHGRCSLALSRPTPQPVFNALAAADVPWERVEMFQVDERAAPDGDPDRNLTLVERDVIGRIDGGGPRVHAIDASAPDLEAAAASYERELCAACGEVPVLDVVHLGLGPDGHTASLLPGDPVLDVRDRYVATTGIAAGFRRITLTYPVLERARLVIFVVAGEPKADALASVLAGDETKPAARVRAADIRFLADAAAASRVSGA